MVIFSACSGWLGNFLGTLFCNASTSCPSCVSTLSVIWLFRCIICMSFQACHFATFEPVEMIDQPVDQNNFLHWAGTGTDAVAQTNSIVGTLDTAMTAANYLSRRSLDNYSTLDYSCWSMDHSLATEDNN
ncbi:hypothetical protein ACOSQ3_003879 [Xanthoceras sorbifolium]